MKSPYIRLGGAGDLDIGAGQMNYVAKASVVGSAEGQGGQGLDQMKGLTLPVRVSGPFEHRCTALELRKKWAKEDVRSAHLLDSNSMPPTAAFF